MNADDSNDGTDDTAAGGKAGRPSKFSKSLAARIAERISDGESLRQVCRDPAMPKMSTVLRWVSENRGGFRGCYELAVDLRAQGIFDEMLEIADTAEIGQRVKAGPKGTEVTTGDIVERSKLRVDARKWMLARMAPKRYGDRITQEISGPDGGPVRTESGLRLTPEDEAFIHRLASAKARLGGEQATAGDGMAP